MAAIDRGDMTSDLWKIFAKLYGIGELIKFHSGEQALNQDEVNLGIGEIVTDLADELRAIHEELESRDYRPNCPPQPELDEKGDSD